MLPFLVASRYGGKDKMKGHYTALPLLLYLSCWDVVKKGGIPTVG